MRRLLAIAIAGVLAAAAPASAQRGSIPVTLTIIEPAAAVFSPELQVRSGRDGVDVSADLRIRGGAVLGILATADRTETACSAWRAERPRTGGAEAVSVRTRCAPPAGPGPRTARAPITITLATN